MNDKVKQDSKSHVASIQIPLKLQGIAIPENKSSTQPRNQLDAHPYPTGALK